MRSRQVGGCFGNLRTLHYTGSPTGQQAHDKGGSRVHNVYAPFLSLLDVFACMTRAAYT